MQPLIYHLAQDADWQTAQARGSYQAPSLAAEGFIHCCTAAQLSGVLERYYQQARGIWLLTLQLEADDPCLHWENTTGGQELFPHYYGVLQGSQVQAAVLLIDAAGIRHWPADFDS